MPYARPVLVMLHGGTGDGPAERTLAAARIAAARDTATSAIASRVVLARPSQRSQVLNSLAISLTYTMRLDSFQLTS